MLPLTPDLPDVRGRRVLVMGLGLFGGGLAVSRTLLRWGARVTVTDRKTPEELRESVEALKGTSIELHLGGHREEDFRSAELIIVNPGVPHDSPHLRVAMEAGVPLDSEMNLFFKRCRAGRIVGVTGSNGKTTTTALLGEILSRGLPRVWVGGNIGRPLIEEVERITPDDVVVLELSSFQLEHLGALHRSPNISVVMNLTPNHLDRHGTMEAYAAAKREIVAHQREGDWKVLNLDDPVVRDFESASPSKTIHFSLKTPPKRGTHAEGNRITLHTTGSRFQIDVSRRQLPGWFNLQNMAAAAAASFVAAGSRWEDWRGVCEEVFASFRGVEHRLEFVGEQGGVKMYNDSIATNPESTIAALETLPGPIVLVAGGYDKKLPFDSLGRAMEGRVRLLVLTGATAPAIQAAALATAHPPEILLLPAFDDAVHAARAAARPGETLLFSPACASYDQFRNFAERGRRFKDLVLSK